MQFEAFVRFYLRVGPHLDVVMTDEVLGTIDRLIRLLFREVILQYLHITSQYCTLRALLRLQSKLDLSTVCSCLAL